MAESQAELSTEERLLKMRSKKKKKTKKQMRMGRNKGKSSNIEVFEDRDFEVEKESIFLGKGKGKSKSDSKGKGKSASKGKGFHDDKDDGSALQFVQTAGCYTDGRCIYSHNANFAAEYAINNFCDWAVFEPAVLDVDYFDLEDGYDFLSVGDRDFTGTGEGLHNLPVSPGDVLLFNSDMINAATGFRVCFRKGPATDTTAR